MYTSYSIEKIASSNRHEALAAAAERRTARAFRATAAGRTAAGVTRHRHHPDPAPAPLVRHRHCGPMTRSVAVHALAPALVPCHDPVVAAARLIGRDEDVAILRDAVVSARGGAPRCVLVTGEAGIGKSRLVREALTGIDDALVVTGHGADMATGEIPFGVLADTLRDLAHQAGPDALTAAEREALAPLLPGSVPSGHVERVQILSAFVDLLQRLCTDRLLVWVVEDLHWADAATRDLVNLAVRTLRGGLVVVATVRTDDPERPPRTRRPRSRRTSAGWHALPGTTVLPLGRLTPDEVRAQLLGLVGIDPAAGGRGRIGRSATACPSWWRSWRRPRADRRARPRRASPPVDSPDSPGGASPRRCRRCR